MENILKQCDWLELMQSLPDSSVDLLLTDMPYNTTNLHWELAIDLIQWWKLVKRVLKPRGAVVMTAQQPFTTDLIISNRRWFRYSLVWVKNASVGYLNAKRQPLKAHEDILVFSRKQTLYNPQMREADAYTSYRKDSASHYNAHSGQYGKKSNDERYPNSVLNFDVERYGIGHTLHPTQKPLALFEYLIRTYTNERDLVLDPFVGSGTTALAAKSCNRHFVCGDISAEYIEIANSRLNPEFGKPIESKKIELSFSDLPIFKLNVTLAD